MKKKIAWKDAQYIIRFSPNIFQPLLTKYYLTLTEDKNSFYIYHEMRLIPYLLYFIPANNIYLIFNGIHNFQIMTPHLDTHKFNYTGDKNLITDPWWRALRVWVV